MALRTKDSLYADSLMKGADRKMYAHLMLLVETYDENFLRAQMQQILDRIHAYQDVDKITLEYNGTSDIVKSEIAALKKKLKPFNIILY